MPGRTRFFGTLCIAAVTLCASPAVGRADTAAPAGYTEAREILQRLTTTDEVPGALLAVHGPRGRTVLSSGVADIRTGAEMLDDNRFRIGSMTKMFVATVVLQLAGEDHLALDAPIERYLPGVVEGGNEISVRQLLQHTSGLPDYVQYLDMDQVLRSMSTHYEPRELVRLALAHPRVFAPGTGWDYSNTNYLLAGMLIEKVTGQPSGAEIERRILQPLGLRDTSVPGDLSAIPGAHPRGYAKPAGSLIDLTEFNPSIAGASGEMISSTSDMERFLTALLDGRLLRPAELEAMMTTRPIGDAGGNAYGLGLTSSPLPCGGSYWGHDGDIFGFSTISGATTDGRTATIMVNLDPGGSDARATDMRAALNSALCESNSAQPAR
ncbi:beta-lactamase family protein [Nocardia yamanashiensis]|uniref:serine hydrolase domain-containing protein n=1 Tax=Nocardia yamanashiensis TaxID=209247 RepID=UPI001E4B4C44|nr:serine hydrolase domain-containing protein [Nocardia yamanashiensis]UGT41257.1 beta-lactamase family protein [Nocardia yamanashiensis]